MTTTAEYFEGLNATLGGRKQLQDNFMPHFDQLETVYSELIQLRDESEENKYADVNTLEELQQELAEIEQSVLSATTLVAGKESLALKADKLNDILLQETISVGRDKQLAAKLLAKAIEFYNVKNNDLTANWAVFKKELIMTASASTITEDSKVINYVNSRVSGMMSGVSLVLTSTGVITIGAHSLSGELTGGANIYLNAIQSNSDAENNVLGALQTGLRDLNYISR